MRAFSSSPSSHGDRESGIGGSLRVGVERTADRSPFSGRSAARSTGGTIAMHHRCATSATPYPSPDRGRRMHAPRDSTRSCAPLPRRLHAGEHREDVEARPPRIGESRTILRDEQPHIELFLDRDAEKPSPARVPRPARETSPSPRATTAARSERVRRQLFRRSSKFSGAEDEVRPWASPTQIQGRRGRPKHVVHRPPHRPLQPGGAAAAKFPPCETARAFVCGMQRGRHHR